MEPYDPIAPQRLEYDNPAHQALTDLELLALIQSGDASAQWSLAARVKPQIKKMVGIFLSKVSPRGGLDGEAVRGALDKEDLITSSSYAVAAAAPKWKPAKGKFSSYACKIVFRACNEMMAECGGPVGVNKELWDKAVQVKNLRDEYEVAFGKPPLPHELAIFANLTEYETFKLLSVIRPVAMLGYGGSFSDANAAQVRTLSADGEVAADNDPLTTLEAKDQKEFIRRAVRQLDREAQLVLGNCFGLNDQPEQAWDELAKQMGTNKTRLYSIKFKALERLRGMLAAEGITASY